MRAPTPTRRLLLVPLALCAVFAGGTVARVQDVCGPFTDVAPALCPYVLEVYSLGITAGTSATAYSPDAPMTRGQASVFVSKGVNQAIARSSRRAALGQWWTPQDSESLGFTTLGSRPGSIVSDGADLWVADGGEGVVWRVRASDSRVLESRTVEGSAGYSLSVLVAMGRVFVAGSNGDVSMIDPSQSGPAQTVASDPGRSFGAMAFDGSRIWVLGLDSVSFVTPSAATPWAIATVTGFPYVAGIVFDGTNIWVTAGIPGRVMRLDSAGQVLESVPLSGYPTRPMFDGSNLWIPVGLSHSVDVVQAATGTRIATLSGNGLRYPVTAAFDGQRVLVSGLGGLSLWNGSDLTPVSSIAAPVRGLTPNEICSDGVNFWITFTDTSGGGSGGSGPARPGGLVRF